MVFALLLVFIFGMAGCAPKPADPGPAAPPPPPPPPPPPETYPSRAIELVAPFGAGGGTDRWARAIASVSADYLDGHPFRVVNRPGAGAAVGTKYVIDSKPDGYTVLIGSSTPIMTSVLEDVGFTYEDLIVVAPYRNEPTVLLVHATAPYKTWEEFVAEAKKRPGEITMGGTGGLRLNLEAVFEQVGISVLHVPYDSTGEAVTDLLGRHIDVAAVTPSTAEPLITTNRGLALMHSGEAVIPIKAFEKVPSAVDLGLEAFGLLGFFAVPKGTPLDRIEYLSKAIGGMLKDTSFVAMQRLFGEAVLYMPYPEAHEYYLQYCKDLERITRQLYGK